MSPPNERGILLHTKKEGKLHTTCLHRQYKFRNTVRRLTKRGLLSVKIERRILCVCHGGPDLVKMPVKNGQDAIIILIFSKITY